MATHAHTHHDTSRFLTLAHFFLKTVSAYSEAVFSRITTPRLESFQVCYLQQLRFSVPQMLEFMGRTENLRFDSAQFSFYSERVFVVVYLPEAEAFAFSINVDSSCLDWQISSVAQIFNTLSQMFSTVEHLTVIHEEHNQSSEEHYVVDRTEWRKLLMSFSNVRTLSVHRGLVEDLSHCLRLEDGEHPLELLPELQELTYPGSDNTNDAFTPFIDARKSTGRPVALYKY